MVGATPTRRRATRSCHARGAALRAVLFRRVLTDEASSDVSKAPALEGTAVPLGAVTHAWASGDEPVLVKLSASAFFETRLDEMLREFACDTVVVTAHRRPDAFVHRRRRLHGYRVLVGDGVGQGDRRLQRLLSTSTRSTAT